MVIKNCDNQNVWQFNSCGDSNLWQPNPYGDWKHVATEMCGDQIPMVIKILMIKRLFNQHRVYDNQNGFSFGHL